MKPSLASRETIKKSTPVDMQRLYIKKIQNDNSGNFEKDN